MADKQKHVAFKTKTAVGGGAFSLLLNWPEIWKHVEKNDPGGFFAEVTVSLVESAVAGVVFGASVTAGVIAGTAVAPPPFGTVGGAVVGFSAGVYLSGQAGNVTRQLLNGALETLGLPKGANPGEGKTLIDVGLDKIFGPDEPPKEKPSVTKPTDGAPEIPKDKISRNNARDSQETAAPPSLTKYADLKAPVDEAKKAEPVEKEGEKKMAMAATPAAANSSAKSSARHASPSASV
jgi:hypothetical protein